MLAVALGRVLGLGGVTAFVLRTQMAGHALFAAWTEGCDSSFVLPSLHPAYA